MAEQKPQQSDRPVGAFSGSARSHTSRRIFLDTLARRCVAFGGMTIILSILAILLVILAEVYPLIESPTVELAHHVPASAPARPLTLLVDEYQEIAALVTENGVLFRRVSDGGSVETPTMPLPDSARITGVSNIKNDRFVAGLSNGSVIPAEIRFNLSYTDTGERRIEPVVDIGEPIPVDSVGFALTVLAGISKENGSVTAIKTGPRSVLLVTVDEQRSLFGEATYEMSRHPFDLPADGEITVMALDQRGDNLFVGTAMGEIVRVERSPSGETRVAEVAFVTDGTHTGVSALGFLNGDRTLIIGDESGQTHSWQLMAELGGERRLKKINAFERHEEAVIGFTPSRRDKGFITLDAAGGLHLSYGTSGQTLVSARSSYDHPVAIAYAPKGDGLLIAHEDGSMTRWLIDNPHPEITWKTLFGKIWYEGSLESEYVWQSTGGTDEFEPKLSLMPLIYGSLKGTFYSLLFAIPLAVLAALYVSQFMAPAFKNMVKPIVEIMAALPSLVLGFIAGLWLAPALERHVPALFVFPILFPVCILAAYYLFRLAPDSVRHRVKPGMEALLLIPVALVAGGVASLIGQGLETWMMAGDYRHFLYDTLGLAYDQRNSLVVGFAMGFAVVPIIFTIAEDSLSNVPSSLVAGSLALGATRWQTAVRMVLPSASPGIFSAIMIGFGRAVGETMIVLMATGNTPVMDWSMFNGFRALSANIAVELPEAPEGGTLYRVLFLAAFLLFVTTFIVNTIAEVVRLHLRKKYRYL